MEIKALNSYNVKTKIESTNIGLTKIYTNNNILLQKLNIPCDIVVLQ